MKMFDFCKVTLSLLLLSFNAYCFDLTVSELSEGACWIEYKDQLKVASFNDNALYKAPLTTIESEIESLLPKTLTGKVKDVKLALHCGAYGSSLVARVALSEQSYCLWTKFEKGKLALRSIGLLNDEERSKELCSGHKWGELLIGVRSPDVALELKGTKWSQQIKEVILVTTNLYKVVLHDDFVFKEKEVINKLEENFTSESGIRYVEFNEYRHPVGEFVYLNKP